MSNDYCDLCRCPSCAARVCSRRRDSTTTTARWLLPSRETACGCRRQLVMPRRRNPPSREVCGPVCLEDQELQYIVSVYGTVHNCFERPKIVRVSGLPCLFLRCKRTCRKRSPRRGSSSTLPVRLGSGTGWVSMSRLLNWFVD